jgi:hypothetical protein
MLGLTIHAIGHTFQEKLKYIKNLFVSVPLILFLTGYSSFRLSSSGPVLGTILFPVPIRIAFLPFCQPTISLIPSSALLEPISIFPLTAAKSSPSLGMVVFGS